MRGSPLLRALVALAVLLFLSWPLARLTRAKTAPELPTPELPTGELKDIRLQLDFTTAPEALVVRCLGKEVWRASAPGESAEATLKLPYSAEGVDLQFELSWPEQNQHAMRVRLSDDAGAEHEKTLWGKGRVVDVLSFP